MKYRFAIAAALFTASAAAQDLPDEPAPLSLVQRSALRCSAAFAIGAALQQQGEGTEWPPLAERGREFFVRVSAQLMDETGRTREQVAQQLRVEAEDLADREALSAAMPPCLLLLDASGI